VIRTRARAVAAHAARLAGRAPALCVGAVALALYLPGLGAAPFLDPPEGFHAEIAREMVERGDFVTPYLNGVRYFNKPPLPYWLMALTLPPSGATPVGARVWSALAAAGTAALTARLGTILGGPRLGLLAGLIVTTNLGMFVFARIVKPDQLFILCLTLAFAGFVEAYLCGRRWPLALFWGGLGLAVLAKDVLGAAGPLAIVALFLGLTRDPAARRWSPWWGIALLAVVAVPWYAAVEARNPGFVWYTIVEVHLRNFAGRRLYPDEDVPLGALEFLAVTGLAFSPWTLVLPWAVARAVRRRGGDATARAWALLALWAVAVIAVFTVSRFKLPHYGLPAFPALALLTARVWDDAIAGRAPTPGARWLLTPASATLALAALVCAGGWSGILHIPSAALEGADVATRNVMARGDTPPSTVGLFSPLIATLAAVLGTASVAVALAAWRRKVAAGLAVIVVVAAVFLAVTGRGLALYARSRSAEPVAEALRRSVRPGDLVVHEGPLENSASILLGLRRPVVVVDGHASNLAFGATLPGAPDVFWDAARLHAAWTAGRVFVVSVVDPGRSVVRDLRPVHRLVDAGGRRLYANVAE
jgi:4-amino-4-deoxy-L-arabinose transferase-like glycosyltransferase